MFSQGFYQKTQDEIGMILSYLSDIYAAKNEEEIGKAVRKIQDELNSLNNDINNFLSTLRTMFDFEEI